MWVTITPGDHFVKESGTHTALRYKNNSTCMTLKIIISKYLLQIYRRHSAILLYVTVKPRTTLGCTTMKNYAPLHAHTSTTQITTKCFGCYTGRFWNMIQYKSVRQRHFKSSVIRDTRHRFHLPRIYTYPGSRWMEKQHLALWGGPCSTQRQVRELISGPNLATGARLLSFNRTQSRVVIGLLTGHNTLRRHLHIMGLCDSPICRKCGTGEESSVHILCECEAFASLRYTYLGSFFLDPEDIRVLSVGAIWNFAK
jgi:hypothetical protein